MRSKGDLIHRDLQPNIHSEVPPLFSYTEFLHQITPRRTFINVPGVFMYDPSASGFKALVYYHHPRPHKNSSVSTFLFSMPASPPPDGDRPPQFLRLSVPPAVSLQGFDVGFHSNNSDDQVVSTLSAVVSPHLA